MSSSIDQLVSRDTGRYGFNTDIDADTIPRPQRGRGPHHFGQKKEPAFLLEWRLEAFRRWRQMREPHGQNVN
ncbi:MAG: hypothetical protein IPF98_25230 [Gemmatimonadetes bacterium]|nr:hypothetical protein [Gemmatimonadota bacterium]